MSGSRPSSQTRHTLQAAIFTNKSSMCSKYIEYHAVFRIRISFHTDPDPGSQKCPYGSASRSRPLIFYSDTNPRGAKIKKDNLYHKIFN